MDFDAFRKAVDFYYAHRDVGQFEKMMLDMLFAKDKQTVVIVLSSLKNELDKILEIYYNNDGIFDEAEPECISNNIEMNHHSEIEELIPKLNSCGAEFCEYAAMVNQDVDRPEGLSDDDAWNKYESALAQHQAITEQLYAVYQKHKECDAIAKLENGSNFSFHRTESIESAYSTLQIQSLQSLHNHHLINYLQSKRSINIDIARVYCREVHYTTGGKPFFAIGFQSDAGGWELRNEYFKGSTSPKSATTIGNSSPTCLLFEGFMDMLSYLTLKM